MRDPEGTPTASECFSLTFIDALKPSNQCPSVGQPLEVKAPGDVDGGELGGGACFTEASGERALRPFGHPPAFSPCGKLTDRA